VGTYSFTKAAIQDLELICDLKMSQCILSPKALRDLNDISSYFAQQNIEAGERVSNNAPD
jgi:hypothetical protein